MKYIHCFDHFPLLSGLVTDETTLAYSKACTHFIVSLAAPCDDISSGDAAPTRGVAVDVDGKRRPWLYCLACLLSTIMDIGPRPSQSFV